jgi:hypothetical protein
MIGNALDAGKSRSTLPLYHYHDTNQRLGEKGQTQRPDLGVQGWWPPHISANAIAFGSGKARSQAREQALGSFAAKSVNGPLRPQAEGPPREINPTYPGSDSREKSKPGVENLQLPHLR